MTELKSICISFSLTLVLSLAVEGALNIDQKWSVGNHFGYEGGFCFPGLCIGGSGGSRFNLGREHYGGGTQYRQTLYCKPLTCWGGSCAPLHLQLDKGLYESLIRKNEAKHATSVDYNIPETYASMLPKLHKTPSYGHRKRRGRLGRDRRIGEGLDLDQLNSKCGEDRYRSGSQ